MSIQSHLTNDMQSLGIILDEAVECGIINGYDRCPGVSRFDIEVYHGRFIQIEVIEGRS